MKTLVIVGPTGSGKTSVSIEIAWGLAEGSSAPLGEIISADSRAIYKGMDIGTAKPSVEEQRGVPHYGIDLVEPGERFTVADWKEYAEQKICSIRERGKVPIVCGGTGLYVDALIYDYQFNRQKNYMNSAESEQTFAEKYPDRVKMKEGFLILGVLWPNEELRQRLEERVNKLFTQELFEETKRLVEEYGWGSQAMKSNIYQYAWGYLTGEYTLEEAKRLNFLDDYHLAKRQMTWFRRNPAIQWLPLDQVKSVAIEEMKKDL